MANININNDSPNKNPYISCKSKRSLLTLQCIIEQEVNRSLPDAIPSDIKAKACQEVKYALLGNVLLNGQPVTGDDTDLLSDIEYEEVDKQKQELIEQELMEQWHQGLLQTSSTRKTAPKHLRSIVKKIIRHELKYLALCNVEVDSPEKMETDSSQTGAVDMSDLEEILKETSDACKSGKQDLEDIQCKVQDLSQIIQLARSRPPELLALYETPPSSPIATGMNGDKRSCVDGVKISNRLLSCT
ncbi:uncharacterized protein LOC128207251 [Mya arenaria]|uniref:uncharacterized protein LOC128207251 n=1 Tax=Mya arenaria TaxID=6604 RepID=UPI0022E79C64|nr:uncharacterized protein LOC128207251 [Mya arenaria]